MKTLRALLGLFVIVGGAYCGWLVIPHYISSYQFQDAITSEAQLGTYSQKTENEIHDIIMKKATELEIPLRPEQVVVHRTNDGVLISAQYTVHVDLPFQPVDLNFSPSSKNKSVR
jgi:Domain of unknown function (DUF4845)